VLVVHNPAPREAESAFARTARRTLLRRASVVVAHSDRLRSRLPADVQHKAAVCPHPPYDQTVPARPPHTVLDPARQWYAFVGALRWDKGIDLVPRVLEQVPEPQRHRLGLVVCGRGRFPDEDARRLHELGVAVTDLTSPEPVPQETLLDVLRNQPVLLAPYVAATQSGSVILALSMGCRVLAFDEGAIADVVTADGLVPTGDVTAMATAVAEGRSGTSVVPLDRWAESCSDAWSAVVLGSPPPSG
jgi:glycosyltransferase involved in cell wall biosynthesis